MRAASLCASSAEELFLILGQRSACGRSAVPFSRKGLRRRTASAAPAGRTLSVCSLCSQPAPPEGGVFLHLTVSRAKPPPSGEVASRSDDGEGSGASPLPETQQLLSRTLIRLLPLVAATFPRLGEGFSSDGKVPGQPAKLPVPSSPLPLGGAAAAAAEGFSMENREKIVERSG